MDLKKIGILGIARSGIAAAEKIKELGGTPFLSELQSENSFNNSPKLKNDFDSEFGGHSDRLLRCKTIIVSPGIPLDIPILRKAAKLGIELISEIEFGYRIMHPDNRIIAVTGSNGKSTTVSLIHHILQTAGFNSILAGNIGKAFCSFPLEKKICDFFVLEISSFQLDLIKSFQPDTAVLLNITPDHLNRYKDFNQYAEAKFRIFENQAENDIAVLNADDNEIKIRQDRISARKYFFSRHKKQTAFLKNETIILNNSIIHLKDSILKGPHNRYNILASLLAVCDLDIDNSLLEKSLKTFTPLPHRLEFVFQKNGIIFINDSKATNTDSVKYALQSFSKPIHLILGGSDKGEDFSQLNELIIQNVKQIYLIGESRNKMKETFAGLKPISAFDKFDSCIEKAYQEALPNEIILLSPACASFDMFDNFEHRGDTFKKIVKELK